MAETTDPAPDWRATVAPAERSAARHSRPSSGALPPPKAAERLSAPNSVRPAPTTLGAPSTTIDSSSTMLEPQSMVLSSTARLALLDALPVAVFLIDDVGSVRFANTRTAEMIGLPQRELLGRNILDFVVADDLDFAVDLLNDGGRFGSRLMGPSRIRYIDTWGHTHWTQVWAQSAPIELGIEGYLVTLTSESVRDVLATAVSGIADEYHLDETLDAIAFAVRAAPIDGRGAVLVSPPSNVDESAELQLIGDWPIDRALVNSPDTPWRAAFGTAQPGDIDDVTRSELPIAARDSLLANGISALFVRPIVGADGTVDGVLVVFRNDWGPASSNQEVHLDEATRLAALAFGQARRRIELERAARLDALTGVANRAAFNERLETERRGCDVLFVDLDHFKTVNDSHGHAFGDRVLALAAQRIVACVRRVDSVYRAGGDEFVVVCEPSGDDPTTRQELADRIVAELREPFLVDRHTVTIGATVGIARAAGTSLDETVRAADRALYEAKERGRAGWVHAD